ncbi:MAG: hypothetical protein LDL39_15025 [Magnetospirillum sp.]|nr:hypothetical protein [Magnetospirillum sp.]
MKRPRRLILILLLAAMLVPAGVAWLAWYNWNIRNTWVRIYPVCYAGGTYIDLVEPMTPLANQMFVEWSTMTRPHHRPEYAVGMDKYIRVKDGKVFAPLWYQTLAGMENRQLVWYMSSELAKILGKPDPIIWGNCRDFVDMATISRRQDYVYRYRLSENAEAFWTFLSFGVDRERDGEYSWVGKLLLPYAIDPVLEDNEPPLPR